MEYNKTFLKTIIEMCEGRIKEGKKKIHDLNNYLIKFSTWHNNNHKDSEHLKIYGTQFKKIMNETLDEGQEHIKYIEEFIKKVENEEDLGEVLNKFTTFIKEGNFPKWFKTGILKDLEKLKKSFNLMKKTKSKPTDYKKLN